MTSTTSKSVTVSEIKPGIALATLDMPGSSANVLTTDLFSELDSTFADLQSRDDLAGLILYSAKPNIFVAGADLNRIVSTLDWPDENIIKFCEDGRSVMARLSRMPFPTVAAIHGACVGGGLELTLWCDYRIASDDRKTILGLPEVKLGLVPGWAGTVRLPRIANLEHAIDLVTSGRVAKAPEALELGFVDQTTDRENLLGAAVELIESEDSSAAQDVRQSVLGTVERMGDVSLLREKYSENIDANSAIYPFACKVVLEHMLSSADRTHDEACTGESLAMAKVYGSDPSYGLLNNFFLTEHNKKKPGFVDLKLANKRIETIGIVGAGLMGASIAETCLKSKQNVLLFDASEEALSQAENRLVEIAKTKKVELSAATSYSDFSTCDLVIESVVEVLDVKKSVLSKIEDAVSDQAIIATNTSAIPLAQLVPDLKRPKQFCGVHFCHPLLMQLVEVVRGANSSDETVANASAWVRGLRKMPVVVNDHAGFVVNRLLAAMLDQAFRLYSFGHSIETIDAAMREFGFRGGPFEIVDVIGADVCMYAGREMYDGGVSCVTLSPILPRMVKKGWLGRKSGRGFYKYESIDCDSIWDPAIDELLSSYVESDGKPGLNSKQIAESICSCIVLEATRILDEGIVQHPKDIDVCIINGFSFPAHVGGILFWADRIGIEAVNANLRDLAEFKSSLKPSEQLEKMQVESKSFY